jgi:hypothetical protein
MPVPPSPHSPQGRQEVQCLRLPVLHPVHPPRRRRPAPAARIGNGAKDDQIRALLAQGMPQQEIAAELGISRTPIQRVAKELREGKAA